MPVRLREATEKDLPILRHHRDAMWVEMGRLRAGDPDPTSEAYGDWLRERLRNGRLKAYLAEDGGRVVGGGALWLQEVQPRPGHPETWWGYLMSVYTEPEARGKGVAREIVEACIAWARKVGCTRVCLHASEAGRPLYEQLGFEPTTEMWLDVRPPEKRPRLVGPDLTRQATRTGNAGPGRP